MTLDSAAALLYVAAIAAGFYLTGCEPREPHWERTCVHSHLFPMTTYNSGLRMPMTTYYPVCDQWDSTWVVPDTTLPVSADGTGYRTMP